MRNYHQEADCLELWSSLTHISNNIKLLHLAFIFLICCCCWAELLQTQKIQLLKACGCPNNHVLHWGKLRLTVTLKPAHNDAHKKYSECTAGLYCAPNKMFTSFPASKALDRSLTRSTGLMKFRWSHMY